LFFLYHYLKGLSILYRHSSFPSSLLILFYHHHHHPLLPSPSSSSSTITIIILFYHHHHHPLLPSPSSSSSTITIIILFYHHHHHHSLHHHHHTHTHSNHCLIVTMERYSVVISGAGWPAPINILVPSLSSVQAAALIQEIVKRASRFGKNLDAHNCIMRLGAIDGPMIDPDDRLSDVIHDEQVFAVFDMAEVSLHSSLITLFCD
jgi:hypothetical protein